VQARLEAVSRLRRDAVQSRHVCHDHMVEVLASDRTDDPLHARFPPRGSRRPCVFIPAILRPEDADVCRIGVRPLLRIPQGGTRVRQDQPDVRTIELLQGVVESLVGFRVDEYLQLPIED
jgi:hypothetical protein